jgi:hypothetical protein
MIYRVFEVDPLRIPYAVSRMPKVGEKLDFLHFLQTIKMSEVDGTWRPPPVQEVFWEYLVNTGRLSAKDPNFCPLCSDAPVEEITSHCWNCHWKFLAEWFGKGS